MSAYKINKVMLISIIIAGSVFATWAITSYSVATNDAPTVSLIAQRLDRMQIDVQPAVIDQTFLAKFPRLAVAIQESDKLVDPSPPIYTPRIYQAGRIFTQVEANAIVSALQLKHENTADRYDDRGNKVGCIDFYGKVIELNGKNYGISLGFPRPALADETDICKMR